MTKQDTRHLLALMSEWFNVASILVAVFGILVHTFSKDEVMWLQVAKGVAFIILAMLMFGFAAILRLMEKSLE
ncbi:MAG: hypothetical protein WA672_01505 [Candidatus Angelobacter sp.]